MLISDARWYVSLVIGIGIPCLCCLVCPNFERNCVICVSSSAIDPYNRVFTLGFETARTETRGPDNEHRRRRGLDLLSCARLKIRLIKICFVTLEITKMILNYRKLMSL